MLALGSSLWHGLLNPTLPAGDGHLLLKEGGGHLLLEENSGRRKYYY
jgi:hypothetical protein